MDNILQSDFSLEVESIYRDLFNRRYGSSLFREKFGENPLPFVIDLDRYIQAKRGRDCNGKVTTIGCHGIAACFTKKTFEKASFECQNQVGQDAGRSDADINFLLGDNFYDDGISHVNVHRQFRKSFITPYADNRLDSFCILGNHDYYIHGMSPWGHGIRKKIAKYLVAPTKFRHSSPEMTLERGLRQVALTYKQPNFACNRAMMYGGSTANNPSHESWNMPYRYYALFSKKADFIILDSNSFLFDEAQQNWFQMVIGEINRCQRRKDRPLVLVMHHPFYCAGKRMNKLDDYHMYANAFGQEVSHFQENHGGTLNTEVSGEVGAMIFKYMQLNEIYFDYLFCAHDHILTVDRLPHQKFETLQIISGGGGGPLANSSDSIHKIFEFRRVSTILQSGERGGGGGGGSAAGDSGSAARAHGARAGGGGGSAARAHGALGTPSLREKCFTLDLRLEHGHHFVDFNTNVVEVYGLDRDLKYSFSPELWS